MKSPATKLLFLAALPVFSFRLLSQTPLDSRFTYQGQIKQSGSPFSGSCDLSFQLWNSLNGGSPVGNPVSLNGVTLANGFFTVPLDLGSVFNGQKRWLEIQAACPSGSNSTLLSPRQELAASPHAAYALQAGNATAAANATNATTAANFSGSLSGDVTGAQSATSVVRLQGRILASTAPSSGQVLKWSGS